MRAWRCARVIACSAPAGRSALPVSVAQVSTRQDCPRKRFANCYSAPTDARTKSRLTFWPKTFVDRRGETSVRLEHHFAHACAAFLPSPYDSATIVVCDHDSPHVSVWNGEGGTVSRVDRTWLGPGFAELYTECAQVLGFVGAGSEQRLEAMARLDPSAPAERFSNLFGFGGDHLQLLSDWRSQIECSVSGADFRVKAGVAAELQARIGQRLLEFVASVKCHAPARTKLCVGGSLFLNSYFNSLVRSSGLFEDVFVPVNPANGGLAIGGALHASGQARRAVTPFLGPSYSPHDVKATLDNCKLTYEWASEAETISIAVDALQHGRLVAWFDGPMEWGSRALGARSILANPRQPHVLENLNHFLKQRDPWRGYALSGVESAVRDHFDGPVRSPFMECDYTPKDRDSISTYSPLAASGHPSAHRRN